jgi:predicted kinase
MGKCVYLLIGQRGAGKSHFAAELCQLQPELLLISRDEMLEREFGSVHLCPYGGGRERVRDLMRAALRDALRDGSGGDIILDCWTGDSDERSKAVNKLRELGAERVVAMYFVTPAEVVDTWFWLKSGVAKTTEMKHRRGEKGLVYFSPDGPREDYVFFHKYAQSIDTDGFDAVIRFDPSRMSSSQGFELLLTSPP